jgi:hypothetical protein
MYTRPHEAGQATLEFLIILPLLLAMTALVLLAGWWSYCKLAAQNAAYSYAVFVPVSRPTVPGSGRAGSYGAQYTVLNTDEGMKPLWSLSLPSAYSDRAFAHSRLGGNGLTIGLSADDLSWAAIQDTFEALTQVSMATRLPRASAYFLYTPLLGAYQP